jgi:soluble lytic murein transglycosylase-like protein
MRTVAESPTSTTRRQRARRRAAALWLALGASAPAFAQIYASTPGQGGSLVLSSFPSDDAPRLLLPAPGGASPARPSDGPLRAMPATTKAKPSAELSQLIDVVAAQTKVAPELLHAVIAVESNYDPHALSPRGAMGLMQLLPATAKRFGAKDPYVAADNLRAGAGYLKWLMALFDDDLELVLAAYNSGEQAVIKAGHKIPPFPETQAYVPRVIANLPPSMRTLR